jgi:hypothetical protein
VLVIVFLWVTVGLHRRMSDLEQRYVEMVRRQAVADALNETSQQPQSIDCPLPMDTTDKDDSQQVAL